MEQHTIAAFPPGEADRPCPAHPSLEVNAGSDAIARYERALRGTRDGVWEVDSAGFWYSSRMAELLGYTRQTLPRSLAAWLELVLPDHRRSAKAALRRHLRAGQPFDVELRLKLAGGAFRWFRVSGAATFRPDGRFERMTGLLEDIEQDKHAYEAFCRNAERLHLIERVALDGLWAWELGRDDCYLSTRWKQILGYDDGELPNLTRSWWDLMDPADHETARAALREHLRDGRPFAPILRYRHKNGATVWGICRGAVSSQGGPVRMVGTLTDITALKQAELKQAQAYQALNAARHYAFQVFASLPSILIGLGSDRMVTLWNPAAERVLGVAQSEALNRTLGELPVPWEADRLEEAVGKVIREGRPVPLDELRLRFPDGRERVLGFSINRINAVSDDQAVILIGSDITDRKILQAQLMLAHKLEALGQLAAGVAHEINTPTQYVTDNTQFLETSFADLLGVLTRFRARIEDPSSEGSAAGIRREWQRLWRDADMDYLAAEIPAAIAQSLEGLARVSDIVRGMKQFCHPGGEAFRPEDLNEAIRNTVAVARNEWKYVADLELHLDPALPPVPCSLGQINQVVLNLVVNAAQAIAEKQAASPPSPPGRDSIRIETRDLGDSVEIRIADTGTGIPEANRGKVFDPFFTTKEAGKGTGQGLPLAHKIVTVLHRGSLGFESRVGEGTTFFVRLPKGAAEAA